MPSSAAIEQLSKSLSGSAKELANVVAGASPRAGSKLLALIIVILIVGLIILVAVKKK